MTQSPPSGLPSQQLGDWTITALSDGYLSASLTLLSNIGPEEAGALQLAGGAAKPEAIHINAYLVQGRGRTVLIDAGAGGFRQWGGHLQNALARAAVAPSDVDTVLLTHAHPDHVGGLIGANGALFPCAQLQVHEAEIAFWEDDGHLSQASARSRENFLLSRQVFDLYRDRTHRFATGHELLPGIQAQPLPGHTAGHTGYRIESGGQALLVWGDIVHFPDIQIAHPQVSIAFDQDPHQAAATRRRLLDAAAAEQLLLAGMHLGQAGFGRLERRRGGYHLAYEPSSCAGVKAGD